MTLFIARVHSTHFKCGVDKTIQCSFDAYYLGRFFSIISSEMQKNTFFILLNPSRTSFAHGINHANTFGLRVIHTLGLHITMLTQSNGGVYRFRACRARDTYNRMGGQRFEYTERGRDIHMINRSCKKWWNVEPLVISEWLGNRCGHVRLGDGLVACLEYQNFNNHNSL